MTNNFNQLDPNQYQLPSLKTPFSLEGHWQPWYDDRRDYNTNAPSYYDYLANFNNLIKDIVDFVNKLSRRDVKTEDTTTIELIKKTSWLVDDLNDIVLKANVKISKETGNKLVAKPDGLFIETGNIDDLKNRVEELERNFNTLQDAYNDLKTRVDLLDGGGWATKEQLEELRKIIEANRQDYEDADSGLMLIIANIQKRLEALDGISAEIDAWNEKVNELEAETLNVKNIASIAGTLVGLNSAVGYTSVPVDFNHPAVNNTGGFHVEYNSYTQRINGRITRVERFGFNYDGLTTGGSSGINPAAWTQLATVNVSKINSTYNGSVSNNLLYQIKSYAYRYYNNYWFDTSGGGGKLLPWTFRVDYNNSDGAAKLTISSLGLPRVLSGADVMRSTTDDYYTIVTWLDDTGNEYLPAYDGNGDPKPLNQCTRINSDLTLTHPIRNIMNEEGFSETAEVNEGIKLVEYNGKMYFSDEAEKGAYTHEVVIPE